MALIRSTMFSDVRGSIAGTTFARNRYGAYARNRTVPVNPNTPAQQAVRSALGNASQGWKLLSPELRTSWENYAAATPVLNRLGETIFLSGQAMYNKYVTWSVQKGLAVPLVPPSTPGLAITLFEAGAVLLDNASGTANSVTFNFSNGSTNLAAIYPAWISVPQSAGTKFFKGPWHYIGMKTGATRGTEYAIPFIVTAGQTFFTKQGYRDESGKLGGDLVQGPLTATNEP